MMRLHPGLLERTTALAILTVVILLFGMVILKPLYNIVFTVNAPLDMELKQLGMDRGLIADDPAIEKLQRSVRHHPAWQLLYKSQDTNHAALELENDVRALINDPDIAQVTYTAILPAPSGPFIKLGLHISMALQIDKLAGLLSKCSNHARLLKVEALSVQSPETQNKAVNPLLNVQLDIYGFMLRNPQTKVDGEVQ